MANPRQQFRVSELGLPSEGDVESLVGLTGATAGEVMASLPRVDNPSTGYVPIVARDNQGDIIGTVDLYLPLGAPLLEDMIVEKQWRRKGVGTALASYVVNIARERSREEYLEVRPQRNVEDLEIARAFSQSLGFAGRLNTGVIALELR